MKKDLKRGLALLTLMIPLSGCATWGNVVTVSSICGEDGEPGAWKPISVSKNDKFTKTTAKEILGNNEAQKSVCGKGG